MLKVWRIAVALLLVPFTTWATGGASGEQAATANEYIYVLHLVPRLYDPKAWTERDSGAVSDHFKRLETATAAGKVLIAGRTREANDATFGIVVFEAVDEAAAKSFMESDPCVVAGVMTAELHPFKVALFRK